MDKVGFRAGPGQQAEHHNTNKEHHCHKSNGESFIRKRREQRLGQVVIQPELSGSAYFFAANAAATTSQLQSQTGQYEENYSWSRSHKFCIIVFYVF